MKKLFSSLLAVIMTVACVALCASAVEYEQGMELETTFPTVWGISFEPTDITGCTAIRFDFYVENAAAYQPDSIEFGSHSACDWQEINFGRGEWAGLADGWNTVTFELNGPAAAATDHEPSRPDDGSTPGFKYDAFQRIRIYNVSGDGSETTIKIKNIVGVKEDGTTVPCGAAPAPVDPTPDDPTPDDPAPDTFDAAASVAVLAIAALGTALVISGKRH